MTTPTAALNDGRGSRRLMRGVVATLPVRAKAIAHAAPSETTPVDDLRSSAAPKVALSFFSKDRVSAHGQPSLSDLVPERQASGALGEMPARYALR
jgi:hypothetical protein